MSRYIDIAGQRFGKLVAREPVGPNKKGEMRWRCDCDCGRQVIAASADLRRGRKTSCPACQRQRFIDLTGQRFGRLVVLAKAKHNMSNGDALWLCQCDCGNRIVTDGQRLRRGQTRSCGCLRRGLSRERARRNPAFLKQMGTAASLRNEDGINKCSIVAGKRNHSGVVGVSFDKHSSVWVARLWWHGKYVLNKTTHSYDEAVAWRKAAEARYFKQRVQDPTATP